MGLKLMRVLLASVFVLSVLCVNLRTTQPALPPIQDSLELFGQAFDSALENFEGKLLAMLYGDDAANVHSTIRVRASLISGATKLPTSNSSVSTCSA